MAQVCFCRLAFIYLGPSIKDVRTLGGGGGSGKSGQIRTGGGGWLAKCGRPLGKKNIATIFVKFWAIIPVCHIFFVVNPIFWNAIIEIV